MLTQRLLLVSYSSTEYIVCRYLCKCLSSVLWQRPMYGIYLSDYQSLLECETSLRAPVLISKTKPRIFSFNALGTKGDASKNAILFFTLSSKVLQSPS